MTRTPVPHNRTAAPASLFLRGMHLWGVRMADWRKAEDYAYTERLRLHDWAWEFLRRNPAYSLAWDNFWVAFHAKDWAKARPGTFILSEESEQKLDAMTAAYDAASRGFGLVNAFDPDLSAVETTNTISWWEAVGVTILEEWNKPVREDRPWPGYPRSIGLSFDFTLPLEAQIEQAKETLMRCRETIKEAGLPWEEYKAKVRVDRSRFGLYLRLLDAERAGASLGEMGRRLFKSHSDQRKSAKNALQRARRMSESGYRELLLMANL